MSANFDSIPGKVNWLLQRISGPSKEWFTKASQGP